VKNPFLGTKFLLSAGMEYVKKLLTEDWWKLPPISVEIDPTNLCNNKCIWCMFREFRHRVRDSIPPEKMEEIINQLGDFGVKAVTFTGGGEPLMNPRVFPQSFYQVRDNGMKVGLVSNGVLVDKYVDAILDTCTFVRFSIDASTPSTYRKLHGTDDFDKVISNVKLVADGEPDVGIAFLVHPENYREVKSFCELGHSLGVDYVEFRPVYMPGLSLGERLVRNVLSQIEEARDLESNSFKIFVRLKRFQEHLNRDKGFTECLATPLVGVIGADLNVYLCCQFRGHSDKVLGNLNHSTFKDIWFGLRRREVVGSIDVNWCPPCRYRTYNQVLNDLKNCDHEEFL